ncbi:uncharacterized protein LOC144440390 [Glandiceps talaboti]
MDLSDDQANYQDLPLDNQRILLKNLAPGTPQVFIRYYLEGRAIVYETPKLYPLSQDDKILVKFSEDIKDFNVLQERIEKKKLKNAQLKMERVRQTNSVAVHVLKRVACKDIKDDVKSYFERSAGRIIQTEIIRGSRNIVLLYFQDYKVVDRVADRHHSISHNDVIVTRHYGWFGVTISAEY